MNPFQLRYKIWFDRDGKVLGKGPYELLSGVQKFGSLSESAKSMNMSYSKAHGIIKRMETNLNVKLINTHIGGTGGGSSELTEAALLLMDRYKSFSEECQDSLNKIFIRHFGDIVNDDEVK